MPALHVVVRPKDEKETHPALGVLESLIDVKLDGLSLAAHVGRQQAPAFVTDVVMALTRLLCNEQSLVTVPLHSDTAVWELGFEFDGDIVRCAVFQQGQMPQVAAFGRELPAEQVKSILSSCLSVALKHDGPGSVHTRMLKSAQQLLRQIPATPTAPPSARRRVQAVGRRGHIELQAQSDFLVLPGSEQGEQRLERADLHSLLGQGSLSFSTGANSVSLKDCQVFLDCERLLALAEAALESWRSLRPTFRRAQLSTVRVGMRRGPGESELELRFVTAGPKGPKTQAFWVGAEDFVHTCAAFAIDLAEGIATASAGQACNLRLSNLQRNAQLLAGQVAETLHDESRPNPRPESYRRYVPKLRRTTGVWEQADKMRFQARWVAAVPRLDLRSTFLCGDRVVVGGMQETSCLDRRSGKVLWTQPTHPAACVVSPSGVVRIEPDGKLTCHHLGNGEPRFSLRVMPRSAGGATGSVLSGPGLPKLLALTEGDRQVTGIDLVTGEVRWRYTAPRAGAYRVRRTGRLLLVAGGDPLAVALDGATGEVVWSLRSRLPFAGEVALDHDSAFALSGSSGGFWQLHKLDPWTGKESWKVELDERPVIGRAPLLCPDAVVVPTQDDKGVGAVAYCRKTGLKLWEHAPGLVSRTTAWLAVDDCVLANNADGILLGLAAATGAIRFNHVFAGGSDSDQPRRMEPILRSGALFVPQSQVHVLRPGDGEILGSLPSDLIPDFIRVDERCDVYVAEESGHLAAFSAAPRLALVS